MSSTNRHAPPATDVFHPRADESEFISAARLLMIAGLTFHHMFEIPNSRFYPRDSLAEFSYFVPDLLNGFVHMAFMAAVPILSVISGFLLLRRPELDFARLLRKRFFSVAVPSWIWSGLWLVVAYVMFRTGQGHGWFEWANYHFEAFDLKALANGIVGLDEYPFAFQFWFVHDLILTLALSPLIYWLLKTLDWPFLLLASLIWLIGVVPPPFYSLNVLYFFCLGAYLGRPSRARSSGRTHAAQSNWLVRSAGVFGCVARAAVLALARRSGPDAA